MVHGRLAEVVVVSALATLITAALAAPVLRAPSDRKFGMEIVGRHHDPFTVMQQFEQPIAVHEYSQPLTDIPGALVARVTGGVAAYNWIVLISFPLSAAAAYLLARHLALSPVSAALAALAFAFSPFHLAHAAYHPQVAQTQWLPLYLLALWRCLDQPTRWAVALLCAATLAVIFSNFYGGLIAAVITPVALAAYWFVAVRGRPHAMRHLAITTGALAAMAGAGAVYVGLTARAVINNPEVFAFSGGDLFRYSAKWWSYLVPPVANPWIGSAAQRLWSAAGVREGMLEQQVTLGLGIIVLGIVALVGYGRQHRTRRPEALAWAPVLAVVGLAALVCSLSPQQHLGALTVERPSGLLHAVAPMFRSYARFGVVVQLMAVILAGIGLDVLLRTRTARRQLAGGLLLGLAAVEYAVSPAVMWRDVLPTSAHRWVMQQPEPSKVLDCVPLTLDSASVPWLMQNRARLLGGMISHCTEPDLAAQLAANRFTHLLVRRDSADRVLLIAPRAPDGLEAAATFADGLVFTVRAQSPMIYTAATAGFSAREHDAEWSWRWMGTDAGWTIINAADTPVVAAVGLELSAFQHVRHLEVRFDGHLVETLAVDPGRRMYHVGPMTVPPGGHRVAFHPVEPPTVADTVIGNGDSRPLSVAIGTWRWTVPGDQP